MSTKQNRTLGAFEKTFWLLDYVDSKDFAIAGEIEGRKSIIEWQQALKKVQARHPNLSVKIEIDQKGRPTLKHINSTIPLRVLGVEENYHWEHEVEKELAVRFKVEQELLIRAVILQKPKNTILILTGHHAIADGTSMTYIFRDILETLNGKTLDSMGAQVSNDETLGLPEDKGAKYLQSSLPNIEDIKSVNPLISSIRFSYVETQKIISMSKHESTTVHGAICAAVLIACRKMRIEWSDKKIELISPVCSRKPLRLDDNYGLNITTHPVYFEDEQHLSFWDLARVAKSGLAGTDTREHVENYINFFRDLTFNISDYKNVIDALKQAFNQEIMVTNLGKVKYDTDFGALKLKSLYGPMVRSGKGYEQTIGVITTNGSLCLTNTSDNPIDDLLIGVKTILVEASKGVFV